MSGLGRYPIEVEAIADELSYLLADHDLYDTAAEVADQLGLDGLRTFSEDERDQALRLLSQTPSQREKTLARLDNEAAALLILRARYLGLRGAQALKLAADLEYTPGKSYRDAAKSAAVSSLIMVDYPDLDLLLVQRGPSRRIW